MREVPLLPEEAPFLLGSAPEALGFRRLDKAAFIGKTGKESMTAQVTKHCCDCKRSWVVTHVVGVRKARILAVKGSSTLALKT